jgi:hypothetical protein
MPRKTTVSVLQTYIKEGRHYHYLITLIVSRNDTLLHGTDLLSCVGKSRMSAKYINTDSCITIIIFI